MAYLENNYTKQVKHYKCAAMKICYLKVSIKEIWFSM